MSHSSGERWAHVDALSAGEAVTITTAFDVVRTGTLTENAAGELWLDDILVRQQNSWVGVQVKNLRRAILEPGIYDGISHGDYHADPVPSGSLSSTQLKWLIPPSCPAKFRWNTDNPIDREVTEGMDIGQVYHTLALGEGPAIVEVKADSWRTKAAQDERDWARKVGRTPILSERLAEVREMVKVLHADPIAKAALSNGKSEQSFFWREIEGVWGRGRVDWLPNPRKGRLIIPDLKSAYTANPADFGRTSATDYGYAQSADWYLRGLRAVGYADERTAFVFVVQEKKPPYLPQVIQLDADSMRVGEILNDRAIQTYIQCRESGRWPGYHEGVATSRLAPWLIREVLESE